MTSTELEFEDDDLILQSSDQPEEAEASVEETTDRVVEDTTEDFPEQQETTPQVEEDVTDQMAQVAYEAFMERGLLIETEDQKFDGTFESLETLIDELPNRIKDQIIKGASPIAQDVIEFILESGQNLTAESLAQFYKDNLSNESPDISQVDSAREFLRIIKQDKSTKSERALARIEDELDEMEDNETILDEAQKELAAKESKTKSKIQEVKQLNAQQQAAQTQWNSQVETYISALPPQVAKEVKTTATNAGKIISEISQKPESYVELMKVLRLYKDGKFDFSQIEKQGATKAVSSLKAKIQAAGVQSASKGKGNNNVLTANYKLVLED